MEKLEWYTEKRKVKDLIPFEYNPRILTDERKEKLRRSLERFNLAEIPAINKDNIILAGHQRVKVMLELNMGEDVIDVRVPNRMLSETEMKEYNVTSNISVGFWDLDILDEAFADIDLLGLGLDVSAIDIPEPDLSRFQKEEEFEFDPEPPSDPVTVKGDIYEFKSLAKGLIHRVHCADSTRIEDWHKTMDSKQADLLLTDPPYNVDYTGGTKEKLKIENDSMSDSDFFSFLEAFYSCAFTYLSEGSPFYIFHADSEGANFRRALTKVGFKLAQCLVWVKNTMVMGRQDYHWMHEPILYGWKLGSAHNWYSDRKQKTVLTFDKPMRNAEHPTMKPLDILEYLIGNSSKAKDLVVDGFLGSGSTLIACEKSLRNCFGHEMGANYCDVIVRRWVKYMIDNNNEFEVLRNGSLLNQKQLNEFTEQ